MTKDDVIRMARDSGCVDPMVFLASYERFAALVAAAEREACADICDQHATCEGTAQLCAAAIRARGQA